MLQQSSYDSRLRNSYYVIDFLSEGKLNPQTDGEAGIENEEEPGSNRGYPMPCRMLGNTANTVLETPPMTIGSTMVRFFWVDLNKG